MKFNNYRKKRIFKSFLRFLISAFMCLSILIGSFSRAYVVDAAATAAGLTFAEVAAYIGTTIGIVNATTNNGVTSAFGHVQDSLQSWWQQYSNDGIYEDSDGNIVFSGAATQAMYEALSSQASIDARIISSWNGSYPVSTQYNSPALNTPVSSWMSSNNLTVANTLFCVSVSPLTSGKYTVKIVAVDITNVAYCVIQSTNNSARNNLSFRDSSGSIVSCSYCAAYQTYNTSNGGSFSSVGTSTNTTTYVQFDEQSTNTTAYSASFYADSDIYLTFPNDLSFCGSSLIISKDAASGNAFINQSSGYVIQNYYTQLPSISKTVLQNNDWQNIYNSYVTNVQNNSESYTNQDGSIDITELRKVLKRYNDVIVKSIQDGVTNIAEQVNYTNEWLDRIYNLLLDIRTILDEGDSGGGTVVTGSDIDYSSSLENIETYLSSINMTIGQLYTALDNVETLISTNNTQNAQIYALLQNIYTALQNIGSGGGGGDGIVLPDSDNNWDDWFTTLRDLPEADLDSLISKFDAIEAVMKGVAPFAYLTALTTFINAIDVTPVEPKWTIPITMSTVNIDEDVDIDLTVFDDLVNPFKVFFLIGFIISLIWLSFWLIPKVMIMFDF